MYVMVDCNANNVLQNLCAFIEENDEKENILLQTMHAV